MQHADAPGCGFGINGDTGEVTDMKALGIWEPVAVKVRGSKGHLFAGKAVARALAEPLSTQPSAVDHLHE